MTCLVFGTFSVAAMAPPPAPAQAADGSGGASLFSPTTRALFYNYKAASVQRMLDFDYVCRRSAPSVAAVITPGAPAGGFVKAFFGSTEVALPVYPTTAAAAAAAPDADVFINFASYRSAYTSSLTAIQVPSIRTLVIIAEGVPERHTKMLIAAAAAGGKTIIGPATVGGVQAGAFKIGDAAGTVDNIVTCKLHRPGSVGFVSKSGGLSNEMYNVLARTTDGLFEGIAVGGDAYPGTTLADHVRRFQALPQIKLIVVLGELGGDDEYIIADELAAGSITKPLVAWVSGTCAPWFNAAEVQFGHAGAKSTSANDADGSSNARDGSASTKLAALRAAGATVPESFEGFADAISGAYAKLQAAGVVGDKDAADTTVSPRALPADYPSALRSGAVRKTTNLVCTISDDRGEEPTYASVPLSELMTPSYGVGDALSLLWFKKLLPPWASRFIELVLVTAADHGPCVSGAHNTIVAARAGKDLISSLCSGLLTIGPRFGGAVDAAAIAFKDAQERGVPPDEFVEGLKRCGRRVEGIGHRIKTAENRDKRVELLSRYAAEAFPSTHVLAYAKSVEAYTLTKASNLVLNIDGCIGALFVDMLMTADQFSPAEVDEVLELGALNGIFVVSRSIGLVGHALDQRRMKQPLYRHPWDDVLYASPERPPPREHYVQATAAAAAAAAANGGEGKGLDE